MEFIINGERREYEVSPNTTLLELIRDRMGLTGTKRGCDQGHCGACTVLMNGEPVNACLVLAPMAAGKTIETIEHQAADGQLSAVQRAFVEEGAVQCGFCTPGMVMSAKALLDDCPKPDRGQIQEALSGNLCRCTGYARITAAVGRAANALEEK